MRLLRHIFLMTVLLSCPIAVMAQPAADRNWDELLDSYESICNRCLELKKESDAGKTIPAGTLTQLMEQLNSLRAELRNGSSKMSDLQKSRFERIRSSYLNGSPANNAGVETVPGGQDGITATTAELLPVPDLQSDVLEEPVFSEPLDEQFSVKPLRYHAILLAGLSPLSGGVMFAVERGSLGAYVKVRSNFRNVSTLYECESSGRIQGGGMIWPSGRSAVVENAAVIGVFAHVSGPVNLYAGAGYGVHSLVWQDVDEQWAKVSDKSFSGLAFDAGAVVSFGHFSLMAGIDVIGLSRLNPEIGVGLNF